MATHGFWLNQCRRAVSKWAWIDDMALWCHTACLWHRKRLSHARFNAGCHPPASALHTYIVTWLQTTRKCLLQIIWLLRIVDLNSYTSWHVLLLSLSIYSWCESKWITKRLWTFTSRLCHIPSHKHIQGLSRHVTAPIICTCCFILQPRSQQFIISVVVQYEAIFKLSYM